MHGLYELRAYRAYRVDYGVYGVWALSLGFRGLL